MEDVRFHELAPGSLIDGKYRIERVLGQGGMGAVFRATHVGTHRVVAVKVINPQFSNNPEFVERFRREAEAAGRLRHPNVVDVTDFGFSTNHEGKVAYLVMEYLDGCTLAEVLQEEVKLARAWVADILEQTCSAVEAAHQIGLVHRDLKPENIWLEPNRRGGYTVKVLDFGLVKFGEVGGKLVSSPATQAVVALKADDLERSTLFLESSPPASFSDEPSTLIQGEGTDTLDQPASGTTSQLTRIGSVMGTPLYMSPEQWRGDSLDKRTDIYSLGVIAYRMLSGLLPFTAEQARAAAIKRDDTATDLREINKRIPKKISRTVMSALASDPNLRPQTAAGFASALKAATEGTGTLLRQAVSLYSEEFPLFIRTSLVGYIPLMILIGLLNFMDKIVPQESFSKLLGTVVGLGIFVAIILASLIGHFGISAVTAPLVIQKIIVPLRPASLRAGLAALRGRWPVIIGVSITVVIAIIIGMAGFAVAGAVIALLLSLAAPVAVMERRGVFRTLFRSISLVKRSWFTALVITILAFGLPVLVWWACVDSNIVFKMDEQWNPKEFSVNFSISGRSALYQLLNILITPLSAIMTSLLYLKTKRAGGESMREAAERFDDVSQSASEWQKRMRTSGISL